MPIFHEQTGYRQIYLTDRKIDYQLKRSQRKTIGLKIDHQGLQVSVPFSLPVSKIDCLLQTKADWIIKKLAVWENKSVSNHDEWTIDTQYSLLGDLWKLELQAGGNIQMVSVAVDRKASPDALSHMNSVTAHSSFDALSQSLSNITSEYIRIWVMDWYQAQATACFSERIEFYAGKLNILKPLFKLSQAKTRWGSCNNRGVIRLNWRLVQLPMQLVDYVIVHELCHLIEMNHSQAFWKLVADIYPEYQTARRKLKNYSLRTPLKI